MDLEYNIMGAMDYGDLKMLVININLSTLIDLMRRYTQQLANTNRILLDVVTNYSSINLGNFFNLFSNKTHMQVSCFSAYFYRLKKPYLKLTYSRYFYDVFQ